jgi:hypothetical protein
LSGVLFDPFVPIYVVVFDARLGHIFVEFVPQLGRICCRRSFFDHPLGSFSSVVSGIVIMIEGVDDFVISVVQVLDFCLRGNGAPSFAVPRHVVHRALSVHGVGIWDDP